LLLQSSVGLLRAGKIAGRQSFPDLTQGLEHGVLSGWLPTPAAEMVMVEAVSRGSTVRTLQILLDGGEILLSSRKVAGLEVLAELLQFLLVNRAGAAELALTEGAA
jgi:hypothetical protein